jgi:hypothetical protein
MDHICFDIICIMYFGSFGRILRPFISLPTGDTICPADNATAGSLGRRRAGQLRFGFVAVLEGHIVYMTYLSIVLFNIYLFASRQPICSNDNAIVS